MLKRQLITSLGLLHPVSKGYQQCIEKENPFVYRKVKKGTLILLPGMDAHDLHFVGKGLFKLYRYNLKAEELIMGLFKEESFMMLPDDFYDGAKNYIHYMTALEDGELLTISRNDMDMLYRRFPESRIHNDRIRSQISQLKDDRLVLLLTPKDDRYGLFLKRHPNLAFRIPQYMISRFLGICSKTLIRSKRQLLSIDEGRK